MTQEELVEKLLKVGIDGEWVKPDECGFSRIFQFKLDKNIIEIEWYWNYCTLMINRNVHFWFDRIEIYSAYPSEGEWIEFSFRGEHPVRLKIA